MSENLISYTILEGDASSRHRTSSSTFRCSGFPTHQMFQPTLLLLGDRPNTLSSSLLTSTMAEFLHHFHSSLLFAVTDSLLPPLARSSTFYRQHNTGAPSDERTWLIRML